MPDVQIIQVGTPTVDTVVIGVVGPQGVAGTVAGSILDDLGDVTIAAVAAGDTLYRSAGGQWVNLPKGTNGQVLTLAAGLPSWATLDVTSGAQAATGWVDDGAVVRLATATDTVLVGHTTALGRLGQNFELHQTATFGGASLNTWSATAGQASIFDFQRSKSATKGTHSLLASGDAIGYIGFRGSDGTTWQNAAQITCHVDATPSAGEVPGRVSIWTALDGSANLTERFRVANDGSIGLGGNISSSTGTGALAYLSAAGVFSVGGTRFVVNSSGGEIVTLTSTTQYSQIRLNNTGSSLNFIGSNNGNLELYAGNGSPQFTFTSAGQAQFVTTGSSAGLLIGGDWQVYRSAANVATASGTFIASNARIGPWPINGSYAMFGYTGVDQTVNGNFAIAAGSGDTTLNAPSGGRVFVAIGNGNNFTWNGTSLKFSGAAATNRKIVLREVADNDHQFYGLGYNTSEFRFQIYDSTDRYAWYRADSTSASTELMRLTGAGSLLVGASAAIGSERALVSVASTATFAASDDQLNPTAADALALNNSDNGAEYVGLWFKTRTAGVAVGRILLTNSGLSDGYGDFVWQNRAGGAGMTEQMRLAGNGGQLRLPLTGSSAGLLIGGDFLLYRSAASRGRTTGSLQVDGTLYISENGPNITGGATELFFNNSCRVLGHMSANGATRDLGAAPGDAWRNCYLTGTLDFNAGGATLSRGTTTGILYTPNRFHVNDTNETAAQFSVRSQTAGRSAITAQGVNDDPTIIVIAGTAAGQSKGITVLGGTNSSDYSLNLTSAASVQHGRMSGAGQWQLAVTGSSAGLLIGGDWQVYRSAANEGTATGSLKIGTSTETATASPLFLNLGGTYSNTAGAGYKLQLFNNGTSIYGLGVSLSSMDLGVPLAGSYNFYVNSVNRVNIDGSSTPTHQIVKSALTTSQATVGVSDSAGDSGNFLSMWSGWAGGTPNAPAIFWKSGTDLRFGSGVTVQKTGVGFVESMRLTSAGQAQFPVTGSSAGILIGGDANLYRVAANGLATTSNLYVLAGAGGGTIYVGTSTSSISQVTGGQIGTQAAILSSGTTGMPPLTMRGAPSLSGYLWRAENSVATLIAGLDVNGRLELPAGSSAGILIGGDFLLYRSAADMGYTPDGLTVEKNLFGGMTQDGGGVFAGAGTAAGERAVGVFIRPTSASGNHRNWVWTAYRSTAQTLELRVSTAAVGDPYASGTTVASFDGITGQASFPVTGSSAGLLIGGDVQQYRHAADVGRTPDTWLFDSHVGVGVTTISPWHSTMRAVEGSGGAVVFGPTAGLQMFTGNAYFDTGSGWKRKAVGYTTAQIQESGQHYWYVAPSGAADSAITWTIGALINNDGRFTVPTPGSAAGVLIGGDVHVYRLSADVGHTPDAFLTGGALAYIGGSTVFHSNTHGLGVFAGPTTATSGISHKMGVIARDTGNNADLSWYFKVRSASAWWPTHNFGLYSNGPGGEVQVLDFARDENAVGWMGAAIGTTADRGMQLKLGGSHAAAANQNLACIHIDTTFTTGAIYQSTMWGINCSPSFGATGGSLYTAYGVAIAPTISGDINAFGLYVAPVFTTGGTKVSSYVSTGHLNAVGHKVQGVASQSANLSEWWSSSASLGAFTAAGQLQVSTTGSSAGLLLGGDWGIYRSAANVGTTTGTFVALNGMGVGGAPSTIAWSSNVRVLTVTGASGASSFGVVEIASPTDASAGYAGIISFLNSAATGTTKKECVSLSALADAGGTANDRAYSLRINTKPDGAVIREVGQVTSAGKLILSLTGSTAGIRLGSDVNFYWDSSTVARLTQNLILGTGSDVSGSAAKLTFNNGGWGALTVNSVSNADKILFYDGGASYKVAMAMDSVGATFRLASQGYDTTNGGFSWWVGATPTSIAVLNGVGQLQLSQTGSSAGILIGGDVHLYRTAADVGASSDSWVFGGSALAGTERLRVQGDMRCDGGSYVYGASAANHGSLSLANSDSTAYATLFSGTNAAGAILGWKSTQNMRFGTITAPTTSGTLTTYLEITSAGLFNVWDGGNLALGTATGTKIGTATGQKFGFWNATPVVQQVLATGAGATVDNVISLLQTLGLCRQTA